MAGREILFDAEAGIINLMGIIGLSEGLRSPGRGPLQLGPF